MRRWVRYLLYLDVTWLGYLVNKVCMEETEEICLKKILVL